MSKAPLTFIEICAYDGALRTVEIAGFPLEFNPSEFRAGMII